MLIRSIGGFLPLRFPAGGASTGSVLFAWTSGTQNNCWLLHNARSALHALWSLTKPKRVWLPAYICGEVVAAVPPSIVVRYYPLDEVLSPRAGFLARSIANGDHVLAIDYFGRPVGREFVALVRARPEIGWIEDRAQALDPGTAPWGDWVLYSPRKVLGVPDGGILFSRKETLPPLATTPATDFSFALPSIARFEDVNEAASERWYADYVREEDAIEVGNQEMSRLSLEILKASDMKADANVRRSNYEILRSRLGEWAFFPDPEISFAPIGFPIRVRSAAALSSHLSGRRIFAARHWQALPSDPLTFTDEHRLAQEMLTLPCDYRYDERDMRHIADVVSEAKPAKP